MPKYFILGCSCGYRIQISTEENRTEIRCPQCHRYVRIPKLADLSDTNTQNRLIGKILEKRYRIDAHLADGAMGRVYRATDLILNIPVAIKVLKPYLIPEHQERRFLNEAKIASELVHPGIIMVRNLHRTRKGIHFMVMDFCPGQSLRNILELQPRLPIPRVIDIGKQILAALEIAHSKGVIHRDIKPANIMIEENTNGIQVRVLDFGIAKVFSDAGGFVCESLTRTGFIIGTTRYMAPEQVVKGKMGRETDIYAVASLMYHLLTGTPPFNEGNRDKILRDIVRKNPTPLRKIFKKNQLGNIPTFLDIVILKALNKDPKQRFRCARDFINALEICQKKIWWWSFPASQILFQTYWGRCQRQIRIGIFAALIIFLVLLPTAFFLHKNQQSNFFQQEANKMLAEKNYEQAYVCLQQTNKNDPSLQHKKNTILMQAILKNIQTQNYEQAKKNLSLWKDETHNLYAYEILESLIEEEILSLQIHKLVATKKIEQARNILQKPLPKILNPLLPRIIIENYLKEEK